MRIPPREVRYGGAMIDQKEIDAVVNVMQTGMSVGAQVQTFESRCAKLLGKEYGVMVNSGSSALLVAVRLLEHPLDVVALLLLQRGDAAFAATEGLDRQVAQVVRQVRRLELLPPGSRVHQVSGAVNEQQGDIGLLQRLQLGARDQGGEHGRGSSEERAGGCGAHQVAPPTSECRVRLCEPRH